MLISSSQAESRKCVAFQEGSAQLEDILYLVSRSGIYPSELELKNVTCTDRRIYGMGRRADVYRGKWERKEIAMKHLRVFHMVQPSQRPELKKVIYMTWKFRS